MFFINPTYVNKMPQVNVVPNLILNLIWLPFCRPEHVTDDQDVENLHFPGISPEAATWLTMKRNVVGVAIDTPSTDRGQSKKFLTHQV